MLLTRLLSIVILLGLVPAAAGAQQPTLEYDVRAAFILNFVRYVEWPPPERQAPLQICVLGENPFGDRLTAVVSGEQWQGGVMEVRLVADVRSATACHLLYVPAAAMSRFTAGAALVTARPVLTVGEHERFLDEGGIMRLFVEENRVRFSVSQRSADRAGLQISSRLLRLARSVIAGTS
jgi:hypothetical protein